MLRVPQPAGKRLAISQETGQLVIHTLNGTVGSTRNAFTDAAPVVVASTLADETASKRTRSLRGIGASQDESALGLVKGSSAQLLDSGQLVSGKVLDDILRKVEQSRLSMVQGAFVVSSVLLKTRQSIGRDLALVVFLGHGAGLNTSDGDGGSGKNLEDRVEMHTEYW